MKKTLIISSLILSNALSLTAQERVSSSQFLQAVGKVDVSIPFNVTAEGQRFTPTWGLDQAWISEQNMRKGLNHMGKENIGIARSAFRTTMPLLNDSALQGNQLTALQNRTKILNIVALDLPVVLTADQEAGSDSYFVENQSADVDHWAAGINSHVHWMQQNTKHPIVGVSPFNEPDYWKTEEGATANKHRDVARILKEQYPRFENIAIVGGNTLNSDKAAEWFNVGSNYYDWGNTHQLAGSFNNYAAYYQMLVNKGKVGYNDEMHNVGEAMIGLEYGMTVGIWWGFDSRARGEFCDISRHGQRLAYGEHRNNWTAASVYRHDDGRVKAFMGSSERQAYTTTYQFVSTEREVYFDGYGPIRYYTMEMPGGTDYQIGQCNGERVIDITWGDDVAPYINDGTYKIVNRATRNVVAINGSSIALQRYTGKTTQQWQVHRCDPRVGGDFSFYDIEAVDDNNIRINVKDYSTSANATLIAYHQDKATSNEQWYLEYAGNGYFYIRNRESALYMASAGTTTEENGKMTQLALQTGTNRNKILWRLLPVDVNYETTAPAQPVNLIAQPHEASVSLSWDANTETDLQSYTILRAKAGSDEWNTIARGIGGTQFTDNTCQQGIAYQYAVKAIDNALNISKASEAVEATPTGAPTMIGRWELDGNFNDETVNMLDAVFQGTPTFLDDFKSGTQALRLLNNRSNFIQLPYQVANSDELTICMWVYVRGTTAWQRLFDFGNDTNHYLFLTPNNGTTMRFAIKNGGNEQIVDCPTKLETMQWKHVAVSIGKEKTSIYINGEEAASSTGITIRPSDIAPVLNYLGRSQFTADPYYNGYLDDVRIYNYALSAEGVQKAMTNAPDAIQETTLQQNKKPLRYYSVDGKKRQQPKTGLNIIDNKKVIIKQ